MCISELVAFFQLKFDSEISIFANLTDVTEVINLMSFL